MRYLALAVLLLPLLTACGEPEVKEPTTSSPPSASPTPILTPPTIPAQAKEDSSEGAAAFAAYWVSTLNYSVNSNDSKKLSGLSNSRCGGCQSYIKKVDANRRSGVLTKGFAWHPSSAKFTGRTELTLRVSSDAYKSRRSKNGPWTSVAAADYTIGFVLERSNDRWLVRDLFIPKGSK